MLATLQDLFLDVVAVALVFPLLWVIPLLLWVTRPPKPARVKPARPVSPARR